MTNLFVLSLALDRAAPTDLYAGTYGGGVYESVEFAKLKLLARALERAQVYEGGRIVVSYLLRTDFADVNAAEPYSEGVIDYLRAVEGAEMAAFESNAHDLARLGGK